MLPYFHARGHLTRGDHLCLEDVQVLKSKIKEEKYEKFTTQGYFIIRRTFKFWSGTWSDMNIEQSLMKNMKAFGDLTRVRVVIDNVMARWKQEMTEFQHICDGTEKF
ncbi:hypothetical protein AVEN_49180-1 [Araneus ventricosus]|uniref:Uncharacterized protein n=1 Tax=Araneus ventricosus TaxID=182803 RepID=A0A4Y2J6U6_ARAVE|nr:hypothetical protein AVEN_49180-1 [Araneus ventricosus]